MPSPYYDLLPEGDDLPVTDLDRIALAVGKIVAILRRPDTPLDPEGAVRMLADALDVRLLPVPRTMMERIDRLGDLYVDTITGVGRRRPELRERLIQGIDDRRREFRDTVVGWDEYDRLYPCTRTAIHRNEADPLARWNFAPPW